jgi:uncharacterized protein YjbJ (UPF0337 family)
MAIYAGCSGREQSLHGFELGYRPKEDAMADLKNEGMMQKLKGKIQSIWGDITDDDVDRAQGDRNQLVGTIKQKTGEREEDIRRKLDDLDKD